MIGDAASLEAAVRRFRALQEAHFVDNCTISRKDGEPLFNPTTGQYVQPTTTIYNGACLFRPEGRQGEDAQAGQQEVRLLDFVLKLPVDTPTIEGDTVTVGSSTYDSGLVGKQFRVSDVLMDGYQICRRAVLEEVVDPEGGA